MYIAQIAPLCEAVPPLLYRGTERVIASGAVLTLLQAVLGVRVDGQKKRCTSTDRRCLKGSNHSGSVIWASGLLEACARWERCVNCADLREEVSALVRRKCQCENHVLRRELLRTIARRRRLARHCWPPGNRQEHTTRTNRDLSWPIPAMMRDSSMHRRASSARLRVS
jgi:hypothetical protein